MSKRIIPPAVLPEYGVTIADRQRRRLEDKGEFPKRVQLTGRSHGYVEAEIVEYIDGRVAARNGEAA